MIDTSTVVTIAIATISGFAVLIGIVWNQHCKRMDALDKRVDEVTRSTEAKFDAIYGELKDFRKDFNEWLLKITTEAMTRAECNRRREECKH
jgi:predicted RNA-binding protein Jag